MKKKRKQEALEKHKKVLEKQIKKFLEDRENYNIIDSGEYYK